MCSTQSSLHQGIIPFQLLLTGVAILKLPASHQYSTGPAPKHTLYKSPRSNLKQRYLPQVNLARQQVADVRQHLSILEHLCSRDNVSRNTDVHNKADCPRCQNPTSIFDRSYKLDCHFVKRIKSKKQQQQLH